MLHDLIIHRFDAELIDQVPGELAGDLAGDGIDDMLGTFLMFDKLAGAGESLQFTATDLELGWHVVRTPGGPVWREGEAPADVTVAAPARELLLILNRRLPAGPVTGDAAVLDRWLEDSRF
jgi:predicted lipid carrier protein YhbT